MPIEIKMPALSPTMEEGTLAKWLVKEGDTVKSGDIMAEIETDKATMEFEAVDEGTIGKILVAEGTDNVKVGTVIATLDGEGEEALRACARAGRGRGTRRSSRRPRNRKRPSPSRSKPARARCSKRRSTTPRCADPAIPAGTEMVKITSARRCATRWPRKCARIRASS